MKAAWGATRARALDALKTAGPMTCLELARYLDLTQQNVAGVLKRLVVRQKNEARRKCRISNWKYEDEGVRDRWRAVYALGFAPDAEKPKSPTGAERQRVARARKAEIRRAAMTCSSIWTVASSIQAQAQVQTPLF